MVSRGFIVLLSLSLPQFGAQYPCADYFTGYLSPEPRTHTNALVAVNMTEGAAWSKAHWKIKQRYYKMTYQVAPCCYCPSVLLRPAPLPTPQHWINPHLRTFWKRKWKVFASSSSWGNDSEYLPQLVAHHNEEIEQLPKFWGLPSFLGYLSFICRK